MWVWYGVWLLVPEFFIKKLATMVAADDDELCSPNE